MLTKLLLDVLVIWFYNEFIYIDIHLGHLFMHSNERSTPW
jgi:hypothetical protein